MKRLYRILYALSMKYDFNFLKTRRVGLLKKIGMKIGENTRISMNVIIRNPANIEIGHNVSIQENCFLSGYNRIKIGNDVSIAHGVSVLTSSHETDGVGIIKNKKLLSEPVEIGNNVWIGMKSSVLMGVSIGDGSVIGAHSLVTKSIDSNAVAFGVPAKVVRDRKI